MKERKLNSVFIYVVHAIFAKAVVLKAIEGFSLAK